MYSELQFWAVTKHRCAVTEYFRCKYEGHHLARNLTMSHCGRWSLCTAEMPITIYHYIKVCLHLCDNTTKYITTSKYVFISVIHNNRWEIRHNPKKTHTHKYIYIYIYLTNVFKYILSSSFAQNFHKIKLDISF